jgi:hypothetical protein
MCTDSHFTGFVKNNICLLFTPAILSRFQVVGDLMDRLCVGGKDGAAAAEEIALMVLGSGRLSRSMLSIISSARSCSLMPVISKDG